MEPKAPTAKHNLCWPRIPQKNWNDPGRIRQKQWKKNRARTSWKKIKESSYYWLRKNCEEIFFYPKNKILKKIFEHFYVIDILFIKTPTHWLPHQHTYIQPFISSIYSNHFTHKNVTNFVFSTFNWITFETKK